MFLHGQDIGACAAVHLFNRISFTLVLKEWGRLVSKVSAVMIGQSLDGYLNELQFDVGVSRGGEAILHAINHLVEDRGGDVGLSMLLVDFKNAFNLVDQEAWYLDDGTIVRDTLVIGKVLELFIQDGPRCGLHLNVHKTEVFWPKEAPRSRLEGVFPPNISRPLHGVKLVGVPVSVDFNFSSELVMKIASKPIGLMDVSAQQSFDVALRSALERITKLIRHAGIVAFAPTFDDALYVFDTSMKTKLLSNPSEIAAPKLIKKMEDIYFTWVTKNAESTIFLSPRQMALWKYQREDHTSDWLRAVPISGLGQTMNARSRVFVGDIYRDHAVSCVGVIGIKHHHNVVRDTLVDICFRSGISVGKEVDIRLDEGVTDHYVQHICFFTRGMEVSSFFFLFLGGIRGGRGYLAEEDPEVLHGSEHWGTSRCANAFNSFISLANLIDLPLDGYACTWAYKTTNNMSKLDRYLVSKGLLALFPFLSALCLDRNLSDHRPILLRELSIDYGPTSFRFFHSWFNLDCFDKIVEDTWKSLATIDSNDMINLKKKLQALKIVIKQWTKNAKKSSYKAKISIQSKLSDIDKIPDQGGSNEEILSDRSLLLKELNDINPIDSLGAAQKSKFVGL
ncbi:putative reverse transcriptase domain-containing protein [Tanacetum coccineum]